MPPNGSTACRADLEAAYEHFLHAASLDGPEQAAAFAYLGHYFVRVKAEEMKARKCYRRALELDPREAAAGRALCDLLHASNSEDLVGGVCEEILARAPSATWARERLGVHHLRLSRPREAVAALQAALRDDAGVASAWEALGAAYEAIGRLVAALKAYARAAELDGNRVYALTQARFPHLPLADSDGHLLSGCRHCHSARSSFFRSLVFCACNACRHAAGTLAVAAVASAATGRPLPAPRVRALAPTACWRPARLLCRAMMPAYARAV
jgi:tetratricopeptide (TPR) repeat protein